MYTFDQRIQESGPAKFRPRTSLRTGVGLAIKDAYYTTWSNSKWNSMSELREQQSDLMHIAHNDFFPKHILDAALPTRVGGMSLDDGLEEEVNFDLLRSYANDHGHSFLSREQIEENARKEVGELHERRQDAYEKASPGVQRAMTAANIGMAMADPVYAPTYVAGFPMAARSFKGIKALMAKRAAGVAVLEGGMESVGQVGVYQWRNELGMNYSVEDALISIGMAAGISGVLTIGADTLAVKLRQFIDNARKAKANPDEIAQAETIVDYLKGNSDNVKAIDVLNGVQTASRKGQTFTNGPTIPDEYALKIYPGTETRAMPSGKVYEGRPSTWKVRLGETKRTVEKEIEEVVAETPPPELLDQTISVTKPGTQGEEFVDRSVREIVEEADDILGSVDTVLNCLKKAA